MTPFPTEFLTSDGLALPCRVVLQDDVPRGAVGVVHGLGDHSRSLSDQRLVDHLVTQGFACYQYDQRGFGRAPGPRAYAPTFGHVRDDLRRFVRVVREHASGQPCYLCGLSLGGLIALDQAIHHPEPLAGIIAAAPALGEVQVSRILRALAPILSRATPHWRLDPGLDLDNLSRDADAVRACVADPLFQPRVSARLGAEIVRAMRVTMAEAPDLRLPLLLLHGSADRITSPAATEAFHARAGAADKTLIVYPDAVHDPLLDVERERVLADISDWLLARARPDAELASTGPALFAARTAPRDAPGDEGRTG